MSKLFVYGVDLACSNDQIKEEFDKFGPVSDVYNTGNGYAFVTFDNKEDSMTAMEQMNGATIFGQQIKVNEARPREGGRGGGGGGRGRGGGGYGGGGRGGGGRGGYGGGGGGYGGGGGGYGGGGGGYGGGGGGRREGGGGGYGGGGGGYGGGGGGRREGGGGGYGGGGGGGRYNDGY